ncbi:MAG TPA: heavy metal-associated domain-containing protein [Bacteroidota bacterium]|nr:heavy metal-associated domain-containing protein [Bacteroidota bacterium]
MTRRFLAGAILLSAVAGCAKPSSTQNAVSSPAVATAEIQLPTLKCTTCVHTIQNALAAVDGIENADVNLNAKSVTVKFIPAKLEIAKIRKVINEAGYDADSMKRDSTAYENLPECCK